MKRPLRWQLEKQRTAKALREIPMCRTGGCDYIASGVLWGDDSGLCARCKFKAMRASRADAPRET